MCKGRLGRCARLIGVLATLLIGPATAQPISDPGVRYQTGKLISHTIRALPLCIQYCLLGIEIRIRYTGYTVEVYFVPRVEHHLAALHVMTSDRFPKEAYIEWAALVGRIQEALLDRLAQVGPPALGLPRVSESSGGRTRQGQYGRQQSTHFKEAEIMGHPVAVLPALVDKNGDSTADTYTEGDTGGQGSYGYGGGSGGDDVGSFITAWTQWASGCFMDPNRCGGGTLFPVNLIRRYFQIQDYVHQIYQMANAVLHFKELAKELRSISTKIADNAGGGGGVKIDRLLCPNDVRYFYPYYLSGPDALFWRAGWPITDGQYTATLLNPFSTDRIGKDLETWGHLYPRHGFINHDHPGRVAVVAAARSAHLVASGPVPLRPMLASAYAVGDWQNLSPEPTAYCAANIAELPTPIDPEGGYAYNIWPRFECPLSEIGIPVAFIPFRYCFTF
ncbi:MAG: hypothetical protein H6974_11795 [Gammaproteobacteria bacterium]|nr:hypothetical protein [Gammaproteobacteria bacterium]